MKRLEEKRPKKLELKRETVRELNPSELREIAGGMTPSFNCFKGL